MTDFLLFTLYAPLVSWGDIAVSEQRGSWDRPSRSAVLGLVAGALGIDRADQAGHDALDAGYGVAVRSDLPGLPLVDYHTTQKASESAVRRHRPSTRAESLRTGELQTVLSRRTYRQDALATVALWARPGAQWSLEQLRDALRRPHYVPYAGRKANPFGLPLHPVVESAATLAEALSRRAPVPLDLPDFTPSRWRTDVMTADAPREVAHDPCEGFESGLRPLRRDVRRDTAPHRGRWHFAERVVHVGLMPAGAMP